MALMGSLVYFGLSVSCLFVSIIFQKYKANNVLGAFMIANAIACFVFSMSYDMWLLYPMRFMMGFTQAFCVIYGPVWVNEFSPRGSNAKWMAFLHSFSVIGVIVGYIVGSVIVAYSDKTDVTGWRFAFMLQGWFMILIGFFFLQIGRAHV